MKLHLGCGSVDLNKGLAEKEWVQVDLVDTPHVDVVGDVRDLSFLEGQLFDLVYASHVLEYFDWTETLDVLREWGRVIVPNGRLMLAVPDMWKLATLYIDQVICLPEILGPMYGRMEVDGCVFTHSMAFDYDVIATTLRYGDFKRVRRIGDIDDWVDLLGYSGGFWDGSMAKIGNVSISLNVEAYKRG